MPGQSQHRRPQSRFGIHRFAPHRARDDPQKGLRPRPVRRVVRHIQRGDPVGGDAFALHLLHQRGQTVGQIIQRRAGEIRRPAGQQPVQKLRQLQPPPQGRHPRRKGDGGKVGHLGHQQQPGQQTRPLCLKTLGHPRPHPLRVQDQGDPCQSLGWLACQLFQQPRHQFGRKVGPRRQGVKMRRVSHARHRAEASRQPQSPRAARHRTTPRDGRCHGRDPPRSSRPRDGSARISPRARSPAGRSRR